MFGFGMSTIDRVLLQKIEQMLAPLGATQQAKKILEDAKSDAREIYGENVDFYSTTVGDQAIRDERFLSERIAAGLTKEEIRDYRNRCLLLQVIEGKIREMLNFIAINIADQQGKDLVEAAQNYFKDVPIYGYPASWDPSLPVNKGRSQVDAPIFVEFAPRIEKWIAGTSDHEKQTLLAKYSSFNAMIRDLVQKGNIGK